MNIIHSPKLEEEWRKQETRVDLRLFTSYKPDLAQPLTPCFPAAVAKVLKLLIIESQLIG